MGNRVFIIAEAGVNHNGSLILAKQLVDKAVYAGADAVKFQTFISEKVVSGQAVQAQYQQRNTGKAESQFEMIKKLELKFEDFTTLKKYSEDKGIQFLSTPFDPESAIFLQELGIEIFKIPSGELTNRPFLELIGSFGRNVIVSTGMATMDEITEAVQIIEQAGTSRNRITVLHCTTEYPAPLDEVNLKAMLHIKDSLGIRVGYSDHTNGIEVPVAAIALGAEVIEKHFTLDKSMEGPDHRASLDPEELKQMVLSIRNVEVALSGDGLKHPTPSEIKNRPIARKSIHMARNIGAGTIIASDMIEMKRPGDGLSPMIVQNIIGRKTKTDLAKDHKLTMEDLV